MAYENIRKMPKLDPNKDYTIEELVDYVRNALKGQNVREAFARSMEKTFDIAEGAKFSAEEAYEITQNLLDEAFDTSKINANFEERLNEKINNLQPEYNEFKTEIINARGSEGTLGERFESVDDNIQNNKEDIIGRGINAMFPPSPFQPAIGDGVTDDTSAIQDLLNFLKETGGTLLLPAKTFRTSSPITVPGGVQLTGVAKSNYGSTRGTIIRPLQEFEGDAVVFIGEESEESTNRMSIELSNIKVDGSASSVANAFKTNQSTSNISLTNLKAMHCDNGFTFDYTWNLNVVLCNTHRCNIGFNFVNAGGTSTNIDACVAYSCDIGFNIQDDVHLHYSSFNNCGVDDTDIGFNIEAPIRNCTFYNCGSEKHNTAFKVNHSEAFVVLSGFSHHTGNQNAVVFSIQKVQQFNLIGVQMITNYKIFDVNEDVVKKGSIKLTNSNIRTTDGRSMGDINCIVDTENKSTYDNPVNMSLFENRDINHFKSTLRINRHMKIVLPVPQNNFWSSVRLITHGFNNALSDNTGGLITLSAYNNNGQILHHHTNSNENNYIEANVVDGTVEFIIKLSHDRGGNFVICELDGYCFRNEITVYRLNEF